MTIFHDEIEIEDFDYDEEEDMYYYPCPCGDRFQISKVRGNLYYLNIIESITLQFLVISE